MNVNVWPPLPSDALMCFTQRYFSSRWHLQSRWHRAEIKMGPVSVLPLPVSYMNIQTLNHCIHSILLFFSFSFFLGGVLFYFSGLRVASGSCHSLRSVNFLLPIKMQIHISMQGVMDLRKPWGFLLSGFYWFNFNLGCLSKIYLSLKVQFKMPLLLFRVSGFRS